MSISWRFLMRTENIFRTLGERNASLKFSQFSLLVKEKNESESDQVDFGTNIRVEVKLIGALWN